MTTAAFFAAVRPLFGRTLSQSQVDGLTTILKATEELPVSHRAYLLATTQHETAHTMQPVRETRAKTDDSAIARLGSGLVNFQSQKMTVAARAMADRKTFGHLS